MFNNQHVCLAGLADDTSLSVSAVPPGVLVQLFYENFALVRAHVVNAASTDITNIIFASVPSVIDSEYLWGCSSGTFDLTGRLWIPRTALILMNRRQRHLYLPTHPDVTSAVQYLLDGKDPNFETEFYFTPSWSIDLAEQSLFSTYDEFLTVMESDFPVPTHLVTTPKNLGRATPIYDHNNLMTHPHAIEHIIMEKTSTPDRFVIRRNTLDDASGAQSLDVEPPPVSEIAPEEEVAVVERIEITPDRFGRLRPVIIAESNRALKIGADAITIDLPTVDDLLARNYEEGDVVQLTYAGAIPLLGSILRKGEYRSRPRSEIQNDLMSVFARRCTYCDTALTPRHNQLYCDNLLCGVKNINRLIHACGPQVLDLPLSAYDIVQMHGALFKESRTPIAQLLGIGLDDLAEVSTGPDEMEHLMEVFQTRINQLYGHGYSPAIQAIMQGRFLDALSLRGLYQWNIESVQLGLFEGRFLWTDLPRVLTDAGALVALGVSQNDVREIAQAASERIEEITAIAVS